jgi:actin-related protein 8
LRRDSDTSQTYPLSQILIIHPGSRNLKIGRASDFYPKEVPMCIARPSNAPFRGSDPPVPGSRAKRLAAEHAEQQEAKRRKLENGDMEDNGDPDAWVNPVRCSNVHLRWSLGLIFRLTRASAIFENGCERGYGKISSRRTTEKVRE